MLVAHSSRCCRKLIYTSTVTYICTAHPLHDNNLSVHASLLSIIISKAIIHGAVSQIQLSIAEGTTSAGKLIGLSTDGKIGRLSYKNYKISGSFVGVSNVMEIVAIVISTSPFRTMIKSSEKGEEGFLWR